MALTPEQAVLLRMNYLITTRDASGVETIITCASVPGVRTKLQNLLLVADLGDLTPEKERDLSVRAQIMKLRRKHEEKVRGDKNYGRGGNNRPILK